MDALLFQKLAHAQIRYVYDRVVRKDQASEKVSGERVELPALQDDEIYTVWLSKTLQNAKGLFATQREGGMYFEVTLNGDKEEMYVDSYKRLNSQPFSVKKEDLTDEN